MSTLMGLPDEILLFIIPQLGPVELYNVSVLSKRLHKIALPLHLANQRVPHPTTSITLKSTVVNALPGLRLSLSIRSTRHLTCKPNADNLLGNIRGLERFVSKLDYTGDVKLDLRNLTTNEDSRYAPETQTLSKATERLLMAVIRSNCKTLTVERGWNLECVQIQSKLGLDPITRSFARNLLGTSSVLGTSTMVNTQSNNDHTYRPSTAIRKLNLISMMLYYPPLSAWSIGTINSSSLVTLFLNPIRATSEIFGSFLRCIEIPSLLELSIQARELHLSDLLEFLSRHHHLATLLLGGHKRNCPALNKQSVPPAKICLPRLKKLTATAEWLEYFLQSEEILPALKFVVMDPLTHYPEFQHLEKIFSLLAPRTQALALSIDIPATQQCTRFLIDHSLDPINSIEGKLHCVSSLEIRYENRWLYDRDMISIMNVWAQWLPLFPSLLQVKFTYLKTGPWPRERFFPMIRKLAERCLRLRSIQLGSEQRLVSNWLKETS